jgi:hypothetical protein
MNIEALAREAGLRSYQEQSPGIDGAVGDWATLARFAALVRAQALEEAIAAAKTVKTRDLEWVLYDVAEAIRALAKP